MLEGEQTKLLEKSERIVKEKLPEFLLDELLGDIDQKKPMVRNAVEHVCKNMSQSCNLTDTANAINVSSEYLSRCFHDEMGMTFMSFVRMIKIDYACVLLKKTNMKIYEIATATGYQNDKYFCNTFKKVIGMQPQKYREFVRE